MAGLAACSTSSERQTSGGAGSSGNAGAAAGSGGAGASGGGGAASEAGTGGGAGGGGQAAGSAGDPTGAAGSRADASVDGPRDGAAGAAAAAGMSGAADGGGASGAAGSAGTSGAAGSAADLAYDAYTKVFYTVTNGKGFYLNNSGDSKADGWWGQAELIEMAIDAYERKKSDAYKTLMTELVYGFVDKQGADWSYNKFNDDIAWMVIASARAHLLTKNADFLGYAKSNWDKMYARAWDTTFTGGGLWWNTDNQSKNACINGPAAIGAFLLYKATGDAAYLTKAKALYAWDRAQLFDAATGAVYDNVAKSGTVTKWTFTYNSGTFIGIANYLHGETGQASYFDDAKSATDFFKKSLCDADGLVKENAISGDGSSFKPIGFRWVAKFVAENDLGATYYPWLQYNANRAWANRRAGDNISWNDWTKPTPHMILDGTGAAATVQILQVVPPGGPTFAWTNSAPQNGRANIEAESCDEKRVAIIEDAAGGGKQLGGVTNDAWARYGNVDFGATSPTAVKVRASVDASAGGSIEVHLDTRTGPLVATVAMTSTGNWTTYAESSAPLTATTGAHDVFLVFKAGAGKAFVCNLDWFTLK
jgi:predicted alpha-1,6-mannanase (GH76 family)